MTKWYEPGRWLLVAALAAQLAGCAQTSRMVGKWTGRDKEQQEVAEVDGRDRVKSKEKVKIASEKDAKKKASPGTKSAPEDQEHVASRSKSKPGKSGDSTTAKKSPSKPKDDAVVAKTKPSTSRTPSDPFTDDEERPLVKKSRSGDDPIFASTDQRLQPKSKKVLPDAEEADASDEETDVREVSHTVDRRPNADSSWAAEEVVEVESRPNRKRPGRDWTGNAEVEGKLPASVAKKLTKLQPSQASYLQLCPLATGDIRELVRGLDEENLDQVKRSIHKLGQIGPDAAPALPALEQLLKHRDGHIRVHAALAMCRIDAISPIALETLTTALKNPDPGLRSFAAAVLAELGPQGGDVTPILAAALEDRDAYVRLHVAEVLIRNDDWSETALETLLACLKHKDENIRWLTTYSLAELAPQSEDAVGALIPRLKDPSMKVRIGAAYALGEIGVMSILAAEELHHLADDSNPELRSAVAYALEQIESGENQED